MSVGGLGYYSSRYEGRIYPGSEVLGVDLGGLSPREARRQLEERARAYADSTITVKQGSRTWTITPSQLGLALQADPIIEQAYSRGRSGSLLARWRRRLPIPGQSDRINARYVLDRGRIDSYVRDLAVQVGRKPVESRLALRADGTLVASRESTGQKLDAPAASELLYNVVSKLRREDVTLPVTELRPAQTRQGWRNAARLRQEAAARPLKLALRERRWTIGPRQLGGALDVRRGEGEIVGAFVPQKVAKLLAPIAADVRREPRDATLRIEGERPALSAEQPGEKLEVVPTLAAAIRSLPAERSIELVTRPLPASLTAAELRPAKRRLDILLGSPMTLKFGDETWDLPAESLAAWTKVEIDPAGTGASVRLDERAVLEFVRTISPSVAREPVDGELTWNGGVVVESESSDGYELRTHRSAKLLLAAAFTPEREVALAVKTLRPRVPTDDLAALGIVGEIQTGTSSFEGSPPERVHNIHTAAAYLDDTVVAPGETFSFNDALGEISLERGYQEGLTILADETVPGVGGGVCQVSTTTFRAAFWAGLPIDERNQHSYLVSYYQLDGSPEGFDAAVYQPYVDLKWTNDTGRHILIQTGWTDDELRVVLYGTDPDREVVRHDPIISERKPALPSQTILDSSKPPGYTEQKEWAHEGMHVVLNRTVSEDGRVLFEDSFASLYKPWGDKFIVGPPKKRAPGARPAPTTEATPLPAPEEGTAEPGDE